MKLRFNRDNVRAWIGEQLHQEHSFDNLDVQVQKAFDQAFEEERPELLEQWAVRIMALALEPSSKATRSEVRNKIIELLRIFRDAPLIGEPVVETMMATREVKIGEFVTSEDVVPDPDHRGSEEINRLAQHVIKQLIKNNGFSLAFIREVVIVPALVNAYAKGTEIGGEYARREKR